jgi:cytochrome b pre-mRNA-processing protein 3
MISLPFRRNRASAASIAALYGMIVAQARKPAFYQSYGVPDTVEGRLDMIVLHLVLAMRALGMGQGAASAASATPKTLQAISQALFDHFCRDIDGNLREMGIGDLAVPKHMQRVAGTFYGRAQVYEAALDAGDATGLEAAIARNVFGTAEASLGARRLASYMREASRRLGDNNPGPLAPAALASAELDFPDPGTISEP